MPGSGSPLSVRVVSLRDGSSRVFDVKSPGTTPAFEVDPSGAVATVEGVGVFAEPILLLAQRVYDALDNFSLLAVPLFVIAGELMNVGGITERLVAMSRAWIGHLRAGLAQANILTNMFMAAISGSALADLAATPDGRSALPNHPNLQRWWAAMAPRESMAATAPNFG